MVYVINEHTKTDFKEEQDKDVKNMEIQFNFMILGLPNIVQNAVHLIHSRY